MSARHGTHDETEAVRSTRNTARYFVENRQVAWVLLAGTLLWGVYAFFAMPKRKDPVVPVRNAAVTCAWPGASAEKIEQLVVTRIEGKIAENPTVEKIEAVVRSSVAILNIRLNEGVVDRAREFDDIKLRLDAITDLPEGAGPVQFIKDFGDVSTLLLTVASPKVGETELALRGRAVAREIVATRASAGPADARAPRATIVVSFPTTLPARGFRRIATALGDDLVGQGLARDARVLDGPGFVGVDVASGAEDVRLIAALVRFVGEHLRISELHPDVWTPVVIRDPASATAQLRKVAGDRYSHRALDEYTDQIQRYLSSLPQVSKVTRVGVRPERIFLDYSQERLAAYGVQPGALGELLAARNITTPGGVLEIDGKNIAIDPSGELKDEDEIGQVLVGATPAGAGLYLRDLVDVNRGYQNPASYLNFLTSWRRADAGGLDLVQTRAVTLGVQMRPGGQIAAFDDAVTARLAEVRKLVPEDLVIHRTSNQPREVDENIALFMKSLYEAIGLVVLVALVGFWEWRSALLLALSIPTTLAMTFGMMHLLGIDLQQISIASLILALGLLVDDPVVAGDAIKRELDQGQGRVVAAWWGPTKLARAIVFATVTNIVAYLPLLVIGGDIGTFIYSLPVVLTCSLVASRLVSMTFLPLLGMYLLRPGRKTGHGRGGFARHYRRTVGWAIDHRRLALLGALLLLGVGFLGLGGLKTAFFPQVATYTSYVNVWLPEDAPLSATREVAQKADLVIREVAEQLGRSEPGRNAQPRRVLDSVTTFVGGGAPRFWFSVTPELRQPNYAQLLIQVVDKNDTPKLAPRLQTALSRIPGARIDVRQLENGKAVGIPIAVRISGEDKAELRRLAREVRAVLQAQPNTERVRDDWGAETFAVKLQVDPDRANLAGVTNLDVALSSVSAMNGRPVGVLREGSRQIPIVARLRAEERAQLADIDNLYVSSLRGPQKVPLRQVSRLSYALETERLVRRNQFPTITVSCFPSAGVLPSQVIKQARPALDRIAATVRPGVRMEIGGEQEEQKAGFLRLLVVLLLSVFGIFLALVLQFQNAIKPLVVYAAIPFGVAGALLSLIVMNAPFGFMAFLGLISLIGVIVSHVIVLFDFIEEERQRGAPLRDALIEAGIVRLRPVLITVGATVLGLVPLALHGGPLWEPLCYVQIGGLVLATFLTLTLVPVLYTVFVRDLGWIHWPAAEFENRP